MFCPMINAQCVGSDCVHWLAEENCCGDRFVIESQVQAMKLMPMLRKVGMWLGMEMNRLMRDPTLSPEQKEAISKAFQSQDDEIARRLLRDAGLIEPEESEET